MYVCICNAVTDKAIIQAASDGANSLKDLKETLKVASGRGRCAFCAKDLLAKTTITKSSLRLQVA